MILTAVFYGQLPGQVAYHFEGGTPDRWLSRGAFIAWLLVPQVFFTLLAYIVVRVVLLSARYWPTDDMILKRLLPVMGNMAGLPQAILTFAILVIFLYNAYEIELIPLWIIAVIIMAAGAGMLGAFFFKVIREARRQRGKSRQE